MREVSALEARFQSASVDLAEAPDFRLGVLRVAPSTRQVEHAGVFTTLEPRVMQVLVALNDEAGQVVSRDRLVDRCWDGRIVGDNAISRVILRLRHLAAKEGRGSFAIETIPRVGYRLRETGGPDTTGLRAGGVEPPLAPPGSGLDRRWLLAGAAGALALAGIGLFGRARPPAVDPVARRLVEQAHVLRESGVPGAGPQALLLLEDAVAIAPDSAEAWGALALVEALGVRPAADAEAVDVAVRARNAAERALALDPGNADATAALAISRNWIGRWTAHERELRAVLGRHPAHVESRAALALFLCQAGRWSDALPVFAALAKEGRLPTASHGLFAAAHSAFGNRMEADGILARAVERWPRHRMLWAARFEYLLAVGRLSDARAMVTDRARFDIVHSPLPMDIGLALADALEGRPGAPPREAVAQQILEARDQGTIFSPAAARSLVLLGQPRTAFAIVRTYLLGGVSPGGRDHPPPPQQARRHTEFFFLPSTAPLRAEPGFGEIVQAIGLADHWRETGTGPQIVP